MTIDNPEITVTQLDAVADLRDRLEGASRIGLICHCCQFRKRGRATFLDYTDPDGRVHELGYWNFLLDADAAKIIQRRRAIGEPLVALEYAVTDADADLVSRLAQSVEDIRLAGGVQASVADIAALTAALTAHFAGG